MYFKQFGIVFFLFLHLMSVGLYAQDSIQVADSTTGSHGGDSLKPFSEKNWKSYENEEERIEFYKEWNSKDSLKLEEKYDLKPKQRALLSKIYKELNAAEKIKYRLAERKIHRKQKKRYKKQKKRFKKTIQWSKPSNNLSKSDLKNLDREQRIRHYKAKLIWESRKEAFRRQKVKKRFERKEKRLRKRYALSQEEKEILNKAQGRALESSEKRKFRKAKRKQIKFTEKLQKLRKKRHIKLQDKETRKRLKQQQKDSRN